MPDQLTSEQFLQSIWAVLRRIEDNMALPPAPLELPAINIAPPDLADVVTAVTSLKPGPTAEEIARAIADVIGPPTAASPDGTDALGQVARALEGLDFRLKGMGVQAYGGGSVHLESGQTIGIAGGVTITGEVEVTNDAGNPLPVRQFASTTATTSRVASSATTVDLLAMKTTRNQASVYNESTAVLYIKFGTGASATDYTLPIAGGGYYELPVRYTGIVTGVWATANGFAQMTEF